MKKETYMKALGAFESVQNMLNNNRNDAPNQCKIYFEHGVIFQSYGSIIAIRFNNGATRKGLKGKTVIGRDWNYSNTTGKYRNEFLSEGISDTRIKIENREYIYSEDLR